MSGLLLVGRSMLGTRKTDPHRYATFTYGLSRLVNRLLGKAR